MQKLSIDGFDEVYRLSCAGSTAFVALHAAIAGRAFGGIRIRAYPTEADALADALLLARAMSRKVAMAGIPGAAPARRRQAQGGRAAARRGVPEAHRRRAPPGADPRAVSG